MSKTIALVENNREPKLFCFVNATFVAKNITGKMSIGRITANNEVDIDLKAGFVSRKHSEINLDKKGIYYVDKESTNGTYLNGKKILSNTKCYLRNGDVLKIENGEYATSKDFVCMIFSTDYSNEYEIGKIKLTENIAEINIGRSDKKDVFVQNEAVSENHATFFWAHGGWAIVDHQSTNGVFINNCRIERPKYLQVGDCIRIANVHYIYTGDYIVYQNPKVVQAPRFITTETINDNKTYYKNIPLKISIAERSVWQRTKKLMLLQNINMTINSGEMVLILGGSGAGKTTFMNAVMGYEKAEGKITHGDTDIYEDFESMKYKIGFVPQQDLIRGSDTVYSTLQNAAEMKMSMTISKERREERIDDVLVTMGLQREKESLVSKLSGGQKKRLSIAVEYIANPDLFFLDEPDSGLDGVMAKSLMENLRMIADEGKIVMVISHSPDRVSNLFDKVIVLAKSVKDNCGHLAFFGEVAEAYEFFDSNSLEGVVKRINREDEGGDGLSDYYIDKYNK